MKVLSTDGLTKLVQLVKSSFFSKEDAVKTQEIELETVQTADVYTKSEIDAMIGDVETLLHNLNSGS